MDTKTSKLQELLKKEQINLHPEWKKVLSKEFCQPYMTKLKTFLLAEKEKGKKIFPPGPEIFSAFNHTPFSTVKVVIIGQDPYHGEGQAHGLSFSVKPGVPPPPSLLNIYREMKNDLHITQPKHGYLKAWSNQGVLLLNAVLTVEKDKAASHHKRGWEEFTDKAIEALNEHRSNLVFLLWGSYAHKKGEKIDRKRHLVLQAVHPSPLSAHRGFFGSRPFSQTNSYLQEHGIYPINWQLDPMSDASQ